MNKIECLVVMKSTDKPSNLIFDGNKIDLRGLFQQKDEERRFVSFIDDRGNTLATSLKDDGFPNIGLDFLWTYVNKNGKIRTVFLFEDLTNPVLNKVKVRNNGDVVVARSDEKEFSEKDVVDILSYALAHSSITSKEMHDKIEETLKWFKTK